MTADLTQARKLYHESVAAFITGNPAAQKPLWSRRDDVTLANPLGPPAKGFEQMWQHAEAASALVSDGEDYSFDPVSVVETADLAYEVGIEHSRVRLGDAPEKVPVSLRVTTIFRREDREWKIVHRHADSITEQRTIQSLASPGKNPTG
jgi:ketosteroid isomerase-like protein